MKRITCLLLCGWLGWQATLASERPDRIDDFDNGKPGQCKAPMTDLEKRHAAITEALQRSSRWLDSFFGDDRDIESLANSVVRLSLDGDYVEAEAGETRLRLRGKLNLPRIQKRLQLVFEGEPDNNDITGLDKADGSASLRYKLSETLLRETSLSLGFRGGLSDPRLFVQARLSRSLKHNNSLARITPAIGHDTGEGWESNVRLDLEQRLSRQDFFRFTERPIWKEKVAGMELQQTFSYFHRFSWRNFMAADWLTSVLTEPSVVVDITRLRIRYRRNLWKNKLFLEVAPGVRFADANEYVMQWELGTRLEMVFEP